MNILKYFLIFFLSTLFFYSKSQNSIFDFVPPVDISMYLSGNFGEIRKNHFHTGIDIKTQGVVGQPVRSIADGYVSRIKVQANGYGNAIYITHNNGYTSVYAHLLKYRNDIQQYVKKQQYLNKTFEIDLYLEKNTFIVEKGDSIALSGNSGGSAGPHLHFEIRDENQRPLNILKYNIDIEDNIDPVFRTIKIYPYQEGQINNSVNPVKLSTIKRNGLYVMKEDTIVKVYGKFGFAVEVYDYLNGVPNRCGIYGMEMEMDDILLNQFQIDKLDFSTLRYINAHIDYLEKKVNNANYHKLYKLPNNKLSFYKYLNNGIVNISDTLNHIIKITAYDAYGNSSVLKFKIKGVVKQNLIDDIINSSSTKLMKYDQRNTYAINGFKIDLPAYSLYDDINFSFLKTSDDKFKAVYHIHNEYTPVQKYYNLYIKPDSFCNGWEEKTIIALLDEEDVPEYVGGEYKNGFVTAESRDFGRFVLLIDTLPPVITPINFVNGDDIKEKERIILSIKDEFSEIGSYYGYIDDNWVLFEYDKKNDIIIHHLDNEIYKNNQSHNLKIIVSDKINNTREVNLRFYW